MALRRNDDRIRAGRIGVARRRRLVASVAVLVCLSFVAEIVPAGAAPVLPTSRVDPKLDFDQVEFLRSDPSEPAPPEGSAPVAQGTASLDVAIDEDVARRDAYSKTFRGEDGMLYVDAYSDPIHYRIGDEWAPIDNTVAALPERPGWVGTADNSWRVAFGSDAEGIELDTGGTTITIRPRATVSERALRSASDREVAIAPLAKPLVEPAPKAKDVPREASGVPRSTASPESSTVTYRNVFPHADLTYEVEAGRLKEDIVVHGSAAPAEYVFDLDGVELSELPDGGLDVVGEEGGQFRIPSPVVIDAAGDDVTVASGVRYEIRDADYRGDLGTTFAVLLDSGWLESLDPAAFPLRVDPTFTLVDPIDPPVSITNLGVGYFGNPLAMGRDGASGQIWRSVVHFGQYEPYLSGPPGSWRVYNAMLQFSGQTPSEPPMTVYNQGAVPSTWAEIGVGKPEVDGPWNGAFVTVTKVMDGWVTAQTPDQWFGIRGVETGNNVRTRQVRLVMAIYQPPPPSFVASIANDAVLSNTTPTWTSAGVPFGPNGSDPAIPVSAEFQITTSPAPNSGLVVTSGMIEQPAPNVGSTWTVPQGTLQEGVTYWAWVLTHYPQFGGPPLPTLPPLANGRRFTVNLGLGDGGPSPTDEIGSVPGEASDPSAGLPGPSYPASKVTVNLVDGNLSTTVATPTIETLAGPLSTTFTYNSLVNGNEGLRATFYNDATTGIVGEIDAADTKVGERVDPTVNFDFGSGILAKAVAAQDPERALARWEGLLTVPSNGMWQLGAISSDGLKAEVADVPRLDQWATHEPQSTPTFGSSFSASTSTPLKLRIDWRNVGGRGVAQMFLRNVTNPSAPVTYSLSPAWLSRSASVLPHGWTMNAAAGTAQWVGLADRGTSVSLFATDGSAHEFVPTGGGAFKPPLTAPTDLLSIGDGGRYTLSDAAGRVYTFRPDGPLESMVIAADDLNPAALEYTYVGDPIRLQTIKDPVANVGTSRVATYHYGPSAPCAGVPAGLLCRINHWNGTTTTLSYDGSGRLNRITNPGNELYDFGYDSDNRMTLVRDPLGAATLAAGIRTDTLTTATQVSYYPGTRKVFGVAQPAPTNGGAIPLRLYEYDDANRTGRVYVDGFTPTVGFAQRTRWDNRNRITEVTGPDGLTTRYVWDVNDRLAATVQPTGVRTTTVFDSSARPVITYGPAPTSSFNAGGIIPNPGAPVPTVTRVYDGGILGTAAAYWNNPFLAGPTTLHGTGMGTGGALDNDWGSTPPVTPGPGGWSTRQSGLLTVPSSANYTFQTVSKGKIARVWVNDQLVVDQTAAEPTSGTVTTTASSPIALPAGRARIRVDMVDTTAPAQLQVRWNPGGTMVSIPGSALSPDYGLITQETDADGKVTAYEYSAPADGIGPHHRLLTATVLDPAGLGLRSTSKYETPGPGSYLRLKATTLPTGAISTIDHYGGTEVLSAATCGVPASTVAQGGRPRALTGPDPDGGGPELPRVEQYVYDSSGRRAGRRVGNSATIASAGWQCTMYDALGRTVSQTFPAHGTAAARSVTFSYAVGANPLVNRVTDNEFGSGITTTVDLLSRPVSYTDVWGNTTTSTWDKVGRLTTTVGPLGTVTQNYNGANGRPTTTVANGITLATPAYDAVGRVSSTTYGNSAATTESFDTNGRVNGRGVFDASGVSGDIVGRSLAGRVVEQQVSTGSGFVDAAPSTANYFYDGAGRLTAAHLPGTSYAYGFGATPSCVATTAGLNTNRTSLTVTGGGAGSTSYCYNHADQLLSTSAIPSNQITYDDRGATTRLGSSLFRYDSSERHVQTETLTGAVTYRRDPLDRLVERTNTPFVTHVASTSNNGLLSVVADRPAGTQAGDLIIASVASVGLLPPAAYTAGGWTLAAERSQGLARTWVMYRTATAADPASWTISPTGALTTTVAVSTYRSTVAGTPVTVTGTGGTSLAASHPLPQVTTTTSNQHLIHVIGFDLGVSPTAPAGVTTRASVSAVPALMVMDRRQPNAGLSSAASVTTPIALNSMQITVAVGPAAPTVTRYGHISTGPVSQFSQTSAGVIYDFALNLEGGTTLIVVGGELAYAHANVHGDTIAVTGPTGNRLWTGFNGPFGEATSGSAPPSATPGTSLAWHGGQSKLTDGEITQMGARPYSSALGRFLTVDPIDGGCANDYTYVRGDPVNQSDLEGTKCPPGVKGASEFLGWRFAISAADKFFLGGKGGDKGAIDALLGGGGSVATAAGSRLAPPKGKHFKKPKGLKKVLGVFGKGAKVLASPIVGAAATVLDYGCEWLDRDR